MFALHSIYKSYRDSRWLDCMARLKFGLRYSNKDEEHKILRCFFILIGVLKNAVKTNSTASFVTSRRIDFYRVI